MITRQKLIDQIEKYKPYNEQEEKDKILNPWTGSEIMRMLFPGKMQ